MSPHPVPLSSPQLPSGLIVLPVAYHFAHQNCLFSTISSSQPPTPPLHQSVLSTDPIFITFSFKHQISATVCPALDMRRTREKTKDREKWT